MEYSEEVEEKKDTDLPYFPIDRSFVISGFGTVVTGTLLSGKLQVSDEIEIFPEGIEGRIRTIQVHDKDEEEAFAGQRVAINIAGIKKDDAPRGSVIAPIDSLKKTMMLDVKIKLLKSIDRSIENRTRVRLYIGTKEILCRIVLLDKEVLNPGEEGYAQLRLEEEIVAKRNDKFIIRFYSPMFTIGGGEVIETNPKKHKRFDKEVVEDLRIRIDGNEEEILEQVILNKSPDFPTLEELVSYIAIVKEELEKRIENLIEKEKILKFSLTKNTYIIHKEYFRELYKSIKDELDNFHESYPLKVGMPKEEIRSKFLNNAPTKLGEAILDKFVKLGFLEQDKEYMKLKEFEIVLSPEQEVVKSKIINIMKENGINPLKREEIIEEISLEENDFYEVYNYLVDSGEIVKFNNDISLYIEVVDLSFEKLIKYIKENGSLSVAEFRDLLGSNRKTALALLEYADIKKVTIREGDKRRLYN